ncbi:hypothetical protein ACHAXA_000604 [Cyclostephanos tholiformis]|uniref:Tubulin-specific chaperone A n=1 Tax=Cyclostephanos tholiformis TaxID=382380 RepID=A0ABD3SQN9_9STRA
MPRNKAKPDPKKQLMIKVKACQRLVKEAAYYEDEVVENESKLERMINDGGYDKHDIKKFREVLSESHMMLPDSARRRDDALADLREYVSMLMRKGRRGRVDDDDDDDDDDGGGGGRDALDDLMTCEWMEEARKILAGSVLDEEGGGDASVVDDEGGDFETTAVDDLAEGEEF